MGRREMGGPSGRGRTIRCIKPVSSGIMLEGRTTHALTHCHPGFLLSRSSPQRAVLSVNIGRTDCYIYA